MIGIIKGDIRYKYLNEMIDDSILSSNLSDFYNIDTLVLPLKGIDNDLIIFGTSINILDILNNNRIKRIIVGNANNRLKDVCNEYKISLYQFLNDVDFVLGNAKLTAKAIIYYLQDGISDISDKRILLLGYGNISYYLARLLDEYDISFKVLPMNDYERKTLMLNKINFQQNITNDYDIIINTVPKVFDIDLSILKGVKILDIASYPFGFDPIEIDNHKIDYHILSMLPSKYAPKSAAILIKKFINNIV